MKIHKILLLLPVLALAACADYDHYTEQTLSGDGTKTPLTVTALLDANAPQTRAANMEFDKDDELLAYIRHVTWDGPVAAGQTENERLSVSADKAPVLVTFTKGSTAMTAYSGEYISPIGLAGKENEYDRHLHLDNTNTQQTSDLTNDLGVGGGHIYWDDFSETAADKNLHTANHYLQSYYGYCYNGGTPVSGTELNTDEKKAKGEIGWAVQTDQSDANTTDPKAFQHSDLLWSAEQTPVRYEHKATIDDNTRQGLVLPYTHAMSKVTINVIAGEGFASDYNFATTGAKLDMVRTTCTATAPTATLTYPTDGTGKADVTMKKGTLGTTDNKPSRPFSAIIVPSVLTIGNKLATISDMDGNEYFIYVTNNIITGWQKNDCLTETDEENNGGIAQAKPMTRANENHIDPAKGHEMKSGVHYILNVIVNKTEVTVSAVIRDWNEVEAEGEGVIHFDNDVSATGDIQEELKAHGFDIYKSTTTTFGAKATTVRWNKANNEWRYNPTIYWNGEAEYFRALWNARTDTPGTTENESLHLENGRDVLWGTTAKEGTGNEGAAIAPRTGDVPLQFYHAMSKITFNLEDAAKGASNDDSKLDLSRATIQLTNLATGGTINLSDGFIPNGGLDNITDGQKAFSEDNGAVPKRMGYYAAKENGTATSYNPSLTLKDYYFTPQKIGDNVMLIITLANGTTYKAQLNTCRSQNGVDGSGNNQYDYVKEWVRGKSYVYTITLAKDTIEFRAEIKQWDEVEASGTITPEW